jgi:hypothetical protein
MYCTVLCMVVVFAEIQIIFWIHYGTRATLFYINVSRYLYDIAILK